MKKYSELEIKEKVKIALSMLLKNDAFLLEHDVNERSISHKLAEYLQQLFPDYDVDCEYNRKSLEVKKLVGIAECRNSPTDNVSPDIIVHHRNSADNVLVIEVKTPKSESAEQQDKKKLELFTKDDKASSDYHYSLGVFIKFSKNGIDLIEWYKDGQKN